MRNLVMAVLLTSAAVSPALAQDNGRWHRGGPQTEQSGDDRAQAREERREARQQENAGARAQVVEQRQVVDQGQRSGGWDRSHFDGRRNVTQEVEVQQQAEQQRTFRNGWRGGNSGAQTDQVRDAQRSGGWTRERSNWTQQSGDYRQRQQVQQQTWDRNRTGTRDGTRSGTWDRNRIGTQSGTWDRNRTGTWDRNRWANGGWDRNWRNDSRYDWRRYRDHHRSTFRLGIYFDPFGYGYRPFDIGYQLYPAYFGQRYWIDPAMYGLPYPPPGTQWVRYWNDAVLVDMYSGQVVDVIHDFFW